MRVLIQSKSGKPYNISATIAAYGFLQRGYEIVPFSVEDIPSMTFDREDIVVGGVGTYQLVFKKFGIDWQSISYPDSLTPFLGRRISHSTIDELEGLLVSGPLFIKPALDDKSFTGFVCQERWDPRLAGLVKHTPLICSETVRFQTEYRVYVLSGKIQNISRYYGSADFFPSSAIIRQMISAYANSPIAYSLDVGVEEKGRTLLVEVNEAIALGNYGLPPTLHAKMIASRWHEIMGHTASAQEEAETIDSPAFLNQV